jgi:hydroxypyruvate reductase
LAAVEARRVTARALAALREDVARASSVRVVAAGKAAAGMARAAAEALEERVVAGVVTSAEGAPGLQAGGDTPGLKPRGSIGAWTSFPSAHPLPDERSEAAGRAALALAADARRSGGLLLVCLSGGASAMLAVPAAGLSLAHKRAVNAHLLRAGLDIGSMNVVRRHLSAIKGGQLGAAAGQSITLAISDVTTPVEDDPLTIGSGPTVGDATTFGDALGVIERAGLAEAMPGEVMAHLRAGAAGGSGGPVPPGDPRLQAAAYWVVGSRQDAMRAAADTARQIGYHVHVVEPAVGGEARRAPDALFARAAGLARPACVIASGETTVRVTGHGRGGRNQELAIASLERLHETAPAALASAGTDGVDGPTDAAGAIVDADMWSALGPGARSICAAALDDNDSYPLLERLGGLVRTGPTGTNVGDLQVLLLA